MSIPGKDVETAMGYSIRKVALGDEAVLAFIQTESWKAAFKHILSDELLAKYTDIGRATEMYKGLLQENKGNGYILSIDGKPHCIAWWDASREKDMPGFAELICIHSLQENWGHGYGGKMMDRLLSDMSDAGYSKVMLWVVEDNERARKFYEAKGFHATDKVKPVLGSSEICYEL